MKKGNGFTLIELLAVIIILGIIMLIAIPSVTRYINESRKDTYIDTARQIVKGAIPLVNSGELDVYDTNTTYYIPASCIPTENSMSSPFGEFEQAYVIVGYTGEGYVYYWASVDKAHQGIEMKEYNKLTKSDVKPNIESIDTTLGIGSRTDIKILDEDECQSFVEGTSSGGSVVYPEGKTKDTVVTGDLVKIGTEEFYVVKNDGDNLILLSRYNLKVGNINYSYGLKIGEYSSSDSGYGLQSSEARAQVPYGGNYLVSETYYGTINFSDESYWSMKVGTVYPGDFCISNMYMGFPCAYVYDSNSKIYPYVNNYKSYLERQGVTIKEARLLKLEEAYELGCSGAWRCDGAPSFVIETSYWLGNPFNDRYFWFITSSGGFGSSEIYSNDYSFGIRPVIVI